MIKKMELFIAVIFLCFFVPTLRAEFEEDLFDPSATISMDFKDVSLKDIMKIFSMQSGLNFIASESVQDRTITLYLEKVSIEEAMDKIFKANNLSYELDSDSNIFIVKEWGKPQIETTTKVFYLKYATVSSSSLKEEMSKTIGSSAATSSGGGSGGGYSLESASGGGSASASGKWAAEENVGLTTAVKKLLSEYGSLVEDYRTNSLIVTDIPNRIPIIEKLIASLDVPIPQVMLEVEMLDVSKNVVDKMGFEFSNTPLTLILPGGFMRRGADMFLGNLALRGKDLSNLDSSTQGGSIILGRTYGQILNFLRTQTDTKFLARPRLLTLNNETAEIKITTQESIGVKTTTTGTTGSTSAEAERMETGVSLRVTPQVNTDTGEILMFIFPQVSEATAGNTIVSNDKQFAFRDPEIRSTKSMVKIKDGDTVIVGGLIRNDSIITVKKLPILGDIPIVGALFRSKGGTNDKNRQRELLVFITPHIIADSGSGGLPVKNGIVPTREQSISSAYDRKVAINSSLDEFEGSFK